MHQQDIAELERQYIALLVQEKSLIEDWMNSGDALSIKHFQDDHRMLLKAIRWGYQNNVPVTRKMVLKYFNENCSSKNEMPANEHIFNVCMNYNVNVQDYTIIKKDLVDSHLDVATVEAIEKWRSIKKKGTNSFTAAQGLKDNIDQIIDESADTNKEDKFFYEPVKVYAPKYFEELKRKIESDEETQHVIKCHIDEIDNCTPRGCYAGGMTIFSADTGNFKTGIMLNVGINLWKVEKKNVLYFPLEMSEQEMQEKMISNLAKVNSEHLFEPKKLSSDEIERVRQAVDFIENFQDANFVIGKPKGGANVEMLRKQIEKKIEDFRPDVVIIDYLGNLAPERGLANSSEAKQASEMIKAIHYMGEEGVVHEGGFHIISAAQIGKDTLKRIRRMSVDKIAFNSEDLRGFHELAMYSSAIFAQMKDPIQPDAKLNFYCVKSRWGPTTFQNGSARATLGVEPAFSRIFTINDNWMEQSREDIMERVENVDIEPNSTGSDIHTFDEDDPDDIFGEIDDMEIS